MINIIGDSHTTSFWMHPEFAGALLGPHTAYNLWKYEARIRSTLDSMSQTQTLFVFGEIDCRIHIHYQAFKRKLPTGTLIARTCDSYSSFVSRMRRTHDIWVLCVLPTGEQENRYNYPVYADIEDRKRYTEYMNRLLESYCGLFHIPFVNIYDRLVDADGFRLQELKADSVHFVPKIADFVLEEITSDSGVE